MTVGGERPKRYPGVSVALRDSWVTCDRRGEAHGEGGGHEANGELSEALAASLETLLSMVTSGASDGARHANCGGGTSVVLSPCSTHAYATFLQTMRFMAGAHTPPEADEQLQMVSLDTMRDFLCTYAEDLPASCGEEIVTAIRRLLVGRPPLVGVEAAENHRVPVASVGARRKARVLAADGGNTVMRGETMSAVQVHATEALIEVAQTLFLRNHLVRNHLAELGIELGAALRALCAHPHPPIRKAAARVCADQGALEDLHALANEDVSWEVRQEATRLLVALGAVGPATPAQWTSGVLAWPASDRRRWQLRFELGMGTDGRQRGH